MNVSYPREGRSSFQSASDAMLSGPSFNHRSPSRFSRDVAVALAVSLALQASAAIAGQAHEQTSKQPDSQQPETRFKVRVQQNLVLVRVVVRDSKGNIVTGLTKDDFRVYDNRKPEAISQFSAESLRRNPETPPAAAPAVRLNVPEPAAATATFPQRYLGLYFDDLNIAFEDLTYARDAAEKFLAGNLTDRDRVSIFASSGSARADFTADRAKLHEALFKLSPKSRVARDCPPINDFLADEIVNHEDGTAYGIVKQYAAAPCPSPAVTNDWIRMRAQQALDQYEVQAANSLQGLVQVVRRMATLPGQRSLILVSSGFMPLGRQYLVGQAIDYALRSQVVISALDARGLGIMPGIDAQAQAPPSQQAESYAIMRETLAMAVMAEVAEGTGGEFFHNNNDLLSGFQKLAAPPEAYYLLAFTPSDLKANAAFHKLKVELVNQHGYTVQSRKGYYAPGAQSGSETPFTDEVETAAYSQNETMGLPVEVHSQFFETGQTKAHLTVLTRIDVRALQFRKENGRSVDSLTLVTIVFDQDGKFVHGTHQNLDLNFKDPTLAVLQKTGMTVKSEFDLTPGTYLVREVVGDEQGKGISALNHPVEIPY